MLHENIRILNYMFDVISICENRHKNWEEHIKILPESWYLCILIVGLQTIMEATFLIADNVPCLLLSILSALSHLSAPVTLSGVHYYPPHFKDEETELKLCT